MSPSDVKTTGITPTRLWLEVFTIWKFQLLASLTSLLGFALLVLLLSTFTERPSSAWPLHIISINGCVAGLTTVIKGSLMVLIVASISQSKWTWFSDERSLCDLEFIDDASRGPWGSLVLLFKHRFRLRIVSFSAILTILATGLEVAFQQLVTIEARNLVGVNQQAHVPWAGSTNPRVNPYAWLSAFEEGIFSDTINDLPATCPSGNCTWNTVPSVGVCAECVDITHLLPQTWISCSGIFCNYSLVATNGSTEKAELAGYVMRNGPKPNSTWDDRVHFSNPNDISFNISMVMSVPWDVRQPSMKSYEGFNVLFGSPAVNTCSFWFCMQALLTKVVSGRPTKPCAPVVATFNNIPGFNMNDRDFVVNQTDTYVDFWLRNERSELNLIRPYLDKPDPVYGFVNLPPLLLDRWNHTKGERSSCANRIAKSLSNKLREANQPSPNEDVYSGEVWTQDIYICVAWYWLAYPALMLVASVAVFITTVRNNMKSRGGLAWGNGTLALLLCDIGTVAKNNAKGFYESDSKLLESIGKIPARLEGDESGWIFQTTV
ncbi:hypothetical protein F4803DRAFT_568537 [Xylaria telfairii]|nr:hypothetical protein F4803DRAFT_568537 [Xylaria telfairii]